MSKIREEAMGWIESHDPEYEWRASLEKAGMRIRLLDKAYRYQRAAARCIRSAAIMCPSIFSSGYKLKLVRKGEEYSNKAASLYKQAEEL